MAEWPPVAPIQSTPLPQEREKTYLQLVDMFVDIVEPDIIQMVLQNRNWDVDAALEDIMILTNPPQSEGTQQVNKTSVTSKSEYQMKSKKNTNTDESVTLNRFSQGYNPGKVFPSSPADFQLKRKKQTFDKPSQYKVADMKKGHQSQLQPFLEQYNYVKATRNPFDRAVMLVKDGVKVMIILRGPPGSGKSYLARKLLFESGIEASAHKRHIFSSDEFFVQNNVYVFVPELLSQAHLWNQRSVLTAIRNEVSPVIVDNTNTQAWEMQEYASMGVSAGYDLEIVEPNTPWFSREGELAKRNVHGVPKAKIRQMIERYEKNITRDVLMKQFNLRYSLSKVPPQPARNCKWRDKLISQRNNKPKKKKSDFSPKTHSKLGDFNSMFDSLQINSPNFSQVGSDLTFQSGNATNFCFPLAETSNEIKTKKESNLSSDKVRSKENKISQSYINGENAQGVYFDEVDTKNVIENTRSISSSSSSLKSFRNPNESSLDPVKIPELLNDDTPSKNPFYQSNDSFDFMAETKKLLEALNRPSTSQAQTLHFSPVLSEDVLGSEAVDIHDPLQLTMPGDNEHEIFLPGEDISSSLAASDQTIEFKKEGNVMPKENTKVAKDLVDSIIDKAINDTKGLDHEKHSPMDPLQCGRGLLWDYVVVNNDNTFIYQRKNSIPLGFPVAKTDHTRFTNSQFTNDTSNDDVKGCQSDDTKDKKNMETTLSSNIDENKSISSGQESFNSCSKLVDITNNNKDLKLQSYLDYKRELCLEENSSQLPKESVTSKESVAGNNPGFTNKNEEFQLYSGIKNDQQKTETVKKLQENENPNVFEMVKDILYSLGPLNTDNHSSSFENCGSNLLGSSKCNNSKDITNKPPMVDKFELVDTTPTYDSFDNWNIPDDRDSYKKNIDEEIQPKPARSFIRPRLLTQFGVTLFNEIDYSKYLGKWDTVSNPAETWGMESAVVKPSEPKSEPSALPQRSGLQRSRNNKNMTDSSTNTNYRDFSLISDESQTSVKVLVGNINNTFSENIPEVKQNVVETLKLDKSTMTIDNSATSVNSYDITQITSLFPNIPEKYIIDMVERCQGDFDWAVDVLLDSEHNVPLVSFEFEDNSNNGNNKEVKVDTKQVEDLNTQIVFNKTSSKQESKSPTHEQAEIKRLLESSVVFDKSHYSEKILKVLKRNHPEYVHLIENSPPQADKNIDKFETSEGSQDEYKTDDEVDEEEESSSSGCEVETEDDTMELVMTNDLILQLQQKFGTSALPKISDMTPIVKLPMSFARQLFGYIMDSLQSDMDEQQSLIEDIIARDEEVARLLQFQDQNSRSQLQEVMDEEIALAIHRADQEEYQGKGTKTLAAKMSQNILIEKFPNVDPKMLTEVFQAHNFSLYDTIDSLTLGLGIGPGPSLENTSQDLPKVERERVTSIIVSDEAGHNPTASGANPVSEAAEHRAQAASYYSLRMDCLSKAHDAFRSGKKTVATYYSQLAQMHKERMEQSNSKAAACLFSTHKTGANTLDLHFLHIREAEVVLDMFLDEVVSYIMERNKRHQTVFLITGRGLRSVGGVSRIKPMVQRKLQGRGIPYNEVNPGMLSALVRNVTPLSYTL